MNRENLVISDENYNIENRIFEDIKKSIDSKSHIMIYDAGAGAGKTYDLIRSLDYIVNNYGKSLKQHGSKILCITYTNVAVNEIKTRLGNTQLAYISTIHEALWDIIKSYDEELLEIHKNKIKKELNKIENSVESIELEYFKQLDSQMLESIKEYFYKDDIRDKYYSCRNENASIFKDKISNLYYNLENNKAILLKNVGRFKEWIEYSYKIKEINNTLKQIDNNIYKKVYYDARFNKDNLTKMRISHDTLLEYSHELSKEYPLINQIIGNKYPYILVDEYQDTHKNVIKLFKNVFIHCKKIDHNIYLGLYGDIKQSIYDNGNSLNFLKEAKKNPSKYKIIKKFFNRRSSNNIIKIGNKVRNDHLVQESIYNNFDDGEVKFYNVVDIDNHKKEEIVNHYKQKWNIDKNNKLYCFELTNALIAERNGFKEFYDFFRSCDRYSGYKYNQLNTEIMSNDLNKISDVAKIIYNILELIDLLDKEDTLLLDVMDISVLESKVNLNINDISNIINIFKELKGENLKEYIQSIFAAKYKYNNSIFSKYIETNLLGLSINSYDYFYNYLFDSLFDIQDDLKSDESYNKRKKQLDNFFNLDINIIKNWYNYILDNIDNDVIYYTLHSSKGREFDNVIIFLTSKFGKDKDYFTKAFKGLTCDIEDNMEMNKEICKVQNLLYVGITRAKLNLSIIYSGDLEDSMISKLESIFGDIEKNI